MARKQGLVRDDENSSCQSRLYSTTCSIGPRTCRHKDLDRKGKLTKHASKFEEET